jgi:hypothetical protein
LVQDSVNNIVYRQLGKTIKIIGPGYDLPESGFLHASEIAHNVNVLNKATSYDESNYVIHLCKTTCGLRIKVYSMANGLLVYDQSIKFFHEFLFPKLSKWRLTKLYPELVLIDKKSKAR